MEATPLSLPLLQLKTAVAVGVPIQLLDKVEGAAMNIVDALISIPTALMFADGEVFALVLVVGTTLAVAKGGAVVNE